MFAHWVDGQGFYGVTNVPAPGPIESIDQGIEFAQFHVERLVNQDNIGIGILIEVGVAVNHIGPPVLSFGFTIRNEHQGQVIGFVVNIQLA